MESLGRNCSAGSLRRHLAEVSRLNRHELAKLAGLAPLKHDSANYRGLAHIAHGRAPLRKALYCAVLVAVRRIDDRASFINASAPMANSPRSPSSPPPENFSSFLTLSSKILPKQFPETRQLLQEEVIIGTWHVWSWQMPRRLPRGSLLRFPQAICQSIDHFRPHPRGEDELIVEPVP